VNTAAKAIASQGLKRRALSLGAVKTLDHALQFLLPVVLVRCLDTVTFGEYRLLWLAVGTLMAIATLNMAGSLYFFVPRSEPRKKRVYIQNTIIYFALAGLACGLAVGPWNPLLPASMQPLEPYGLLVPAFVAMWLAGLLLEHLPTIDERIRWQAYASVTVALLRAVLVGAGAWATGDLGAVLCLLLAVAAIKLAVLLYYVYRHHGLGRPWFERASFSEQLRHAAPFGVSNALFQLRSQSDQWVAASLFALTSFAAFSIAAIVGQVVHIFRHSVMEAFMPTMSRMEAAGDVAGMMEMNSRANAMVGTALFPLLAAAFMFAEELITIVYTASYVEAAPVMRLYIVGMVAMVVEIGSVILLLRQGPFALKVTAAALALSVAVSWSGAQLAGLTGAAAGSVLAIYFDRALVLRRVSGLTGIPLRRLQDWRALAWALASAALAAVLAELIAETFLRHLGDFARLVAGTAILGTAYLAMNYRKLLR
jgi:O-antigen/teichoic acid export membrane protein